MTRARPWLIGLAASATMLVLVAAIGNPPATRAIYRHAYSSGFGSRALQSTTYFGWNFGQLGDNMHLYLAALVFDLAVLVVVVLLVAALSSGSGSFWRTFLAAWVGVIVAVMLCGYVRAAIVNPLGTAPGNSKAETIFFSQYSPGPLLLFVAMIYGLVAALVAALVAVLTRRHEVVTSDQPVPPPAEPEQPTTLHKREPWAAPPAAVPGPVANPSPWANATDEERTTQLPVVDDRGTDADDGSDHTRALPRVEDDRPPA